MDFLNKFKYWQENVKDDQDLVDELVSLKDDQKAIEDAFYSELSFGTGGLRGIIGVGSNRINIYTIRKASQGIANYINKNFKNQTKSVAISYDSRIKSFEFAIEAARVYAANNIKVFIYKTLKPTPMLSYAVRTLNTTMGVMITASHNPNNYNGYKVYDSLGNQIIKEQVNLITLEIEKIDPFKDVKLINFKNGLKQKMIDHIPDDIETMFINRIKQTSVIGSEKINKNVKIVYSPLNGTGLEPVTRMLKEIGFNNITLVNEQCVMDGLFKTCPYPNPEVMEAMELGIKYAKEVNADLVLATDPDCDRVGVAVKSNGDEYYLISGNQMGILLLDFICMMRLKNKSMPINPVAIKTIVTSDMADIVGQNYGVEVISCLTGFKYIGELISSLEDENRFILGFEESYGYLTSNHVRDKDAVNASLMIAEMFAYYKTNNISLLDKLNELYSKYGFFSNKTNSFSFPGKQGKEKMNTIMARFRNNIQQFHNLKVVETKDYLNGVDNLPKENVIKFFLDGGSTITVRPSGTEPKIKIYFSMRAKDKKSSLEMYENILKEVKTYLE